MAFAFSSTRSLDVAPFRSHVPPQEGVGAFLALPKSLGGEGLSTWSVKRGLRAVVSSRRKCWAVIIANDNASVALAA